MFNAGRFRARRCSLLYLSEIGEGSAFGRHGRSSCHGQEGGRLRRGQDHFSFLCGEKRNGPGLQREKSGAGVVPAYANRSAARRTGLRQQVAASGGTTYVPDSPSTLLTSAAAASGVWLGAWVVLPGRRQPLNGAGPRWVFYALPTKYQEAATAGVKIGPATPSTPVMPPSGGDLLCQCVSPGRRTTVAIGNDSSPFFFFWHPKPFSFSSQRKRKWVWPPRRGGATFVRFGQNGANDKTQSAESHNPTHPWKVQQMTAPIPARYSKSMTPSHERPVKAYAGSCKPTRPCLRQQSTAPSLAMSSIEHRLSPQGYRRDIAGS